MNKEDIIWEVENLRLSLTQQEALISIILKIKNGEII